MEPRLSSYFCTLWHIDGVLIGLLIWFEKEDFWHIDMMCVRLFHVAVPLTCLT